MFRNSLLVFAALAALTSAGCRTSSSQRHASARPAVVQAAPATYPTAAPCPNGQVPPPPPPYGR